MYKEVYAVCLRNPLEEKPLIIVSSEEKEFFTRDVSDIRAECVISYGFSHIIDAFRKLKITEIPFIVDIEVARRLLTGKPRSEYKNKTPWELSSILGKHVNHKSLKFVDDYQNLRIIEPEVYPEFSDIVASLISGFKSSWQDTLSLLEEAGEYKRYFDIENPIFNLFINSQLTGIKVDQDGLDKKLKSLKSEYYSNIKALEFEYGFVSQNMKFNMSWEDVKEYCQLADVKDEFDYNFWDYVELYSEFSPFLARLLAARKSKIDFDALLKYRVDSYGRIYPRFQTMGTVTGRILVSSPGIQYLKKTSRDIFVPEDGNVFLYADFDQFEPGIVASFSNDQKLTKIYNTGDVYKALSEILFDEVTEERRKLSKTIFLSYLYGMQKDKLFSVIEKISSSGAAKKGILFFDLFHALLEWKKEACNQAKESGFASSIVGNRRYIGKKGHLSAKEERWVPSQIIQGTASYIFKKSLLRIASEVEECQVHIPMHDAILLELPESYEEVCKEKIREILVSEYEDICKNIVASVSFESFSG